jgi:hypothetical protein
LQKNLKRKVMGYHYGSNYFLDRKIDKLIAKAEKKSLEKEADFVNRLATGVFEGFTVKHSREAYSSREFKILENKNGNKIEVPVPESNYKLRIYLEIYKERCGYYLNEGDDLAHVVTVIVQNFKSLENDCLKRQNELDRKNKIFELSKNSTMTWLTNVLKDSDYTYSIASSSLRVMLSIKLKNKTQLNIPIYYRNFQKVMPKLMDFIKEYEKLIENSDFKATVTNLKKRQRWINRKS